MITITPKKITITRTTKKLIMTTLTTTQSDIYIYINTLYIQIQEKFINNKTPNSLPAWCRCGRSLCYAGHRGQGLHLLQGETAREDEAQTSTKNTSPKLRDAFLKTDGKKFSHGMKAYEPAMELVGKISSSRLGWLGFRLGLSWL